MYLSQLEIVGFKSFAQKTQLKYNDGITAIVGPNGCGKTNVVDAIRWVLGEQKTSTLRSDKMEDVIFNGTKTRKPLGLAEVSMTIENTRGILPSEYSEITITRRLFRNGESQYLLNKTICRLRDIVDLFMDTGMGPNAYSVIELKMIETILNDRTEDRRRLFEEAAGVTKYKTRRKEAERKLQNVQSDLMRVNDILTEVQKSVRSLSRQADRARKYKEIADELQSIERKILIHEYSALLGEIAPLEQYQLELKTSRSQLDQELIEQETTVTQLEEDQSQVELRLSEAESHRAHITGKLSEASKQLAVAQERIASLHRSRERMSNEVEEMDGVIVSLERNMADTVGRQEALYEHKKEAEEDFSRKKTVQDATLVQVQDVRGQARVAKDTVVEKLNSINALQSKTERNIARVESLRRRIEETMRQQEQSGQRLTSVSEHYEQEVERRAEFSRAIAAAEQSLHEAQEHQAHLRHEMDEAKEEAAVLQAQMSHKIASLEFLKGLVDTNESSAFLMNSQEWKTGAKRILLAEAISTEERFRAALESALGNATGYFIVESVEEALAARQTLRQHEKGKATFICLERIPAISPPSDVPAHSGIFAWASEVIRADERLVHAVRGLLGSTLIVNSIETAWEVVQSGLAQCAVSLEGELVRSNGVLRGGGRKLTEGALIGKREQIEELQEEIAVIEERIAQCREKLREKTGEHQRINLRVHSDSIRQAEAERNKHEQQISQLVYQRDSIRATLNSCTTEIAKFAAEIAEIESQDDNTLVERMQALHQERQEAEDRQAAIELELRAVEQQLDEDSAATHQAEMRLVQLRGEEKNLLSELERLHFQVKTTKERRAERLREMEQSEQESVNLEEQRVILESDQADLRVMADQALALRNEIAEEQALLRKRIQQQAELLRGRRKDYEEATQRLHEADLQMSQLRSRAEHCVLRARNEFEMELQVPVTEEEGFILPETRDQARELKSKLQAYGAVNLMAFEEFEKENERLEFLQAQLRDLNESENTLQQTIQEINQTAQHKFSEIFGQIRENFIRIFKSLFEEGDEADLHLAEGDPLEADIEIIAKPRGKRPHSIEMLSGGEKTLTAIALLFAIYLVKPSPFCILDEVDAPLDDANIGRFVRLIREFSTETQFIIITHNKRTMEAADTLFGVTMEEEGVSKIVSVQFSGKAA